MNYVAALIPVCLASACMFFKFASDEYKEKDYFGSFAMALFGIISVADVCWMAGMIIQ